MDSSSKSPSAPPLQTPFSHPIHHNRNWNPLLLYRIPHLHPNPSFANATAFKSVLEEFTPEARFLYKDGMPVVQFSPQEMAKAKAAFSTTLIMKFPSGIPLLGEITNNIKQLWGLKQIPIIGALDYRHFMIEMSSEDDVTTAIAREIRQIKAFWYGVFCATPIARKPDLTSDSIKQQKKAHSQQSDSISDGDLNQPRARKLERGFVSESESIQSLKSKPKYKPQDLTTLVQQPSGWYKDVGKIGQAMHDDFKNLMQQNWPQGVYGNRLTSFMYKLKCVKKALRSWNKYIFGNVTDNLNKLSDRIMELDFTLEAGWDDTIGEEPSVVRKENADMLLKEETFWREQSRIKWIAAGDANTQFFHKATQIHRKTYFPSSFTLPNGTQTQDLCSIHEAAISYYTKVLTAEATSDDIILLNSFQYHKG
ncbi:hypothetical protein GIB67_042402 [Kingdonia uniflora]|uniref:DUF4283 domain-containing protein n=1 Tax=Kingdonia uniflora TaxID=39325 RepID=A0A7J7M847_9MAGN|nr:hypothetical protein GIB67_042402 [Kingdonia uniflora]